MSVSNAALSVRIHPRLADLFPHILSDKLAHRLAIEPRCDVARYLQVCTAVPSPFLFVDAGISFVFNLFLTSILVPLFQFQTVPALLF